MPRKHTVDFDQWARDAALYILEHADEELMKAGLLPLLPDAKQQLLRSVTYGSRVIMERCAELVAKGIDISEALKIDLNKFLPSKQQPNDPPSPL